MAMTHDNHGWDDDEETIINFTPKQRVAPVKSAEETPPVHSDGPHARISDSDTLGSEDGPALPPVPQVPPLMNMDASILGMDSALAGMETPPPSGLYGTQAPMGKFGANH